MRAIGIILAGGNNNRMRELSDKRAIAAMPIAGSYRSIDFALSNMANSRIQKVAVLGFRKKARRSFRIYTYYHQRKRFLVSGNRRCYLSELKLFEKQP